MLKESEESKLRLSEETLKDIKEAREDLRKGRVYTSRQVRKALLQSFHRQVSGDK